MHVGSATVGARLRPLDGAVVRLRLAPPLPLRVGDRLLLRDPGSRRVLGADVLDVDPPELRRRGAARQRAAELAARPPGRRPPSAELARRRVVRAEDFAAMGWPRAARTRPAHGPWLVAAGVADELAARVPDVVARYRQLRPLEPGPPVEVLRRALDLPDADLLTAVVRPPFVLRDGRVVDDAAALPAAVQRAVDDVRAPAGRRPLRRPGGAGARRAGLGARELAAAVRSGQLVRIAEGVVPRARGGGRGPRPAGGGSRSRSRSARRGRRGGPAGRVAVPLMEWLDARGVTERLPDNTRRLR